MNDDEAVPLARFCLEHGYQLRFIEQMPLDAQHGWRRDNMVTADEILAALSAEFSLTPDDPAARGSAPAEAFLVDGGPARIGVIGSVTRPFCGSCDRVRLTADGQIRNCLFATAESDLRGALRAGASDAAIAAALAPGGRVQAARSRHQRPRIPAASPADVGHRRLTGPAAPCPSHGACHGEVNDISLTYLERLATVRDRPGTNGAGHQMGDNRCEKKTGGDGATKRTSAWRRRGRRGHVRGPGFPGRPRSLPGRPGRPCSGPGSASPADAGCAGRGPSGATSARRRWRCWPRSR